MARSARRARPALPHRAASLDLRARLRAAGLRATVSRVAVMEMLERASAPLSHAEVVDAFVEHGWDRATIYRNLVDLAEAGLIRRTTVGQVWRFEAVSEDGDAAAHPHFVCTECGTIECVDSEALTIDASKALPRSVRTHEVEIQLRGRCDDCR